MGARSIMSGMVLPLSHLFTAGAVTPRHWAISSWVSPLDFLFFLIISPMLMSVPPVGKDWAACTESIARGGQSLLMPLFKERENFLSNS